MNKLTRRPARFVLQRALRDMRLPALAVPGAVISAAAVAIAAFLWTGSPQPSAPAEKAPEVPAAAVLRGLEARVEQEQSLRARMDFEQFVTELGLNNATLSSAKRSELLDRFQRGPVAPAAAPVQPAATPSEAPEVTGRTAVAAFSRHRASPPQAVGRKRLLSGRGSGFGEQQVALSTGADDAALAQAPEPAPVMQVEAARPPVPAYIGTYSTDRNGVRSFHPGP